MEKKSFFEGIAKLCLTRFNLVGLSIAFYLGYQYHQPISRVEDNLLHRKTQIEKSFFPDPNCLQIYKPINDQGKREVYILNIESKKKTKIGTDMLPDTPYLVKILNQRNYEPPINTLTSSLEKQVSELDKVQSKQLLNKLYQIQGTLYQKIP